MQPLPEMIDYSQVYTNTFNRHAQSHESSRVKRLFRTYRRLISNLWLWDGSLVERVNWSNAVVLAIDARWHFFWSRWNHYRPGWQCAKCSSLCAMPRCMLYYYLKDDIIEYEYSSVRSYRQYIVCRRGVVGNLWIVVPLAWEDSSQSICYQ